MLQLPEAVQTVSDTIVKISQVDICVDTFSALIQHFLYEMLFGRYYIMCSGQKRTCINRSLFCGKLKSLAVGRKVVNKIAERLRGKLSLWHCNYLPICRKRNRQNQDLQSYDDIFSITRRKRLLAISHRPAVVLCENL